MDDNLAEVYRIIQAEFGRAVAVKMSELFRGTQVYFPDIEKGDISKRNEEIKAGYNGYNSKELALRFGLSERWIKEIVEGNRRKSDSRKSDFEQISIFETEIGSRFLKSSNDSEKPTGIL